MDKKDLILQRSFELFQQYGVVRITMDLIANKCGVSKKTIYTYFKNKDDLLYHIVEIKANELQVELTNYSKEYPNALLSIQAFLERSYSIFTNIFANFLRDINRFHPTSFELIIALKENLILTFIPENIRQGKQEGIYRADLDENQLAKSYNRIFTALLSKDLYLSTDNNIHSIAFLNQLFIYRLLATHDQEKLASLNLEISL